MNSCEKVGRVWDEEFRCGWAVYPTAAPLQNGTLRRCDCIRINCFIPDRVSVAGLSSVIEGMSCFPDFSSLASVICLFDAFHQNPSFWCTETPEHDKIFSLSHQACRLVLCQPSHKAKQSKIKCESDSCKQQGTDLWARLHTRKGQRRHLRSCDAWIQTSLHPLIPIK